MAIGQSASATKDSVLFMWMFDSFWRCFLSVSFRHGQFNLVYEASLSFFSLMRQNPADIYLGAFFLNHAMRGVLFLQSRVVVLDTTGGT